jgi:hypothetical protein
MRRHYASLTVYQRDFRALHLARTAFAAQLPDSFSEREHRAGVPGMTMRQQAPVGVNWQFTTEFDAPTFDKSSTLALGTKTEILHLRA